MLYGGIKIEETQSIIVILGEDNKLFIPHDIIVANNTTDIQNFVNSMQRGGITPEKICFAINPVHVNSIEAFIQTNFHASSLRFTHNKHCCSRR